MNPAPNSGAYSTSKMAASGLFQHLAEEFQSDKVQLLSIHPGNVFTPRAEAAGLNENSLPWDNGKPLLLSISV